MFWCINFNIFCLFLYVFILCTREPLQTLRVRLAPSSRFKPPSNSLLTVPRRWFWCGSLLPVFGIRVSVMFHLMFVYYTFSSVWVAEWPPFWKLLPTRLAICFHCILSICNFSYFPFWFSEWDLSSDCSSSCSLLSHYFFQWLIISCDQNKTNINMTYPLFHAGYTVYNIWVYCEEQKS